MMVAILQLKASKLIVYFVSFTVVIFTILYKVHAPISSILVKPRDMNSLTLLDALCPKAYTLYSTQYT